MCIGGDGRVCLFKVATILREWEAWWVIPPTWSDSLYRAMADLDAIRATQEIVVERRVYGDGDELDGFEQVPEVFEGPNGGNAPEGDDPEVLPAGEDPAVAGGGERARVEALLAPEGPPLLRVRRGHRRRAAVTVYQHIVAEAGLRQDSPGQREVVMDLAVKVLKRLNVRISDRPQVMADVVAIYFTPTDEQLSTAAVMRNSWHARLRKEVGHAK